MEHDTVGNRHLSETYEGQDMKDEGRKEASRPSNSVLWPKREQYLNLKTPLATSMEQEEDKMGCIWFLSAIPCALCPSRAV
jgi:hypothetical protein